jgi:hypothetical protein
MRPQGVVLKTMPISRCSGGIPQPGFATRRSPKRISPLPDAEPRQQAQQGTFAAARRPQQRHDAASIDMQVYLIQNGMSAEGERNAVEFDAGKRALSPSLPGKRCSARRQQPTGRTHL